MPQTDEVLGRRVRAREVVDDDLRNARIGIVAKQHEWQPFVAKRRTDLGRQSLKHDAAIDLAAQHDLFPRATVVDRRKDQVVAGGLQSTAPGCSRLRVHALENPGIVGV